jgi:hypothetical protein
MGNQARTTGLDIRTAMSRSKRLTRVSEKLTHLLGKNPEETWGITRAKFHAFLDAYAQHRYAGRGYLRVSCRRDQHICLYVDHT